MTECRNNFTNTFAFFVYINRENQLTWPKSIVKLTSEYFKPRDIGGLCHQLDVPSMAFVAGWLLFGSIGSQKSQIYASVYYKHKNSSYVTNTVLLYTWPLMMLYSSLGSLLLALLPTSLQYSSGPGTSSPQVANWRRNKMDTWTSAIPW